MIERANKHVPNTQWNEDRPRQAYKMALLGLTLCQMAEVMDVSPKTLEYWQSNKPEFREMLKAGREKADMKVAESFFLNTQDRYVEEEEVHVYKGVPSKVKVKKFIQGDKWAQARWLALRQKPLWADNSKVELNQTNILNIQNLDLSIFNDQELLILKKAGLNQIQTELDGDR
jgi:transcriptional regulator with XRE-family HTH domain